MLLMRDGPLAVQAKATRVDGGFFFRAVGFAVCRAGGGPNGYQTGSESGGGDFRWRDLDRPVF